MQFPWLTQWRWGLRMKINLVFAGLLLASLFLLGCVQQEGTGTPTPGVQQQGMGRVVFAAKDAAADLNSVSSIEMTVDNIEAYSQAKGWTQVSTTAKTFDLVKLKNEGSAQLLADARLEAGNYDKVRMRISNVMVADASGRHAAKLPSSNFETTGRLQVSAESTSTATFDFIADQSLHTSEQGDYIMAPVVDLETRSNAQAQATGGSTVEISGGSVLTNVRVGMDVNGNVGVGLKIPANAVVSITAGGGIEILGGLNAEGEGRLLLGITDAAADMQSVSSVKVTVDQVQVHSTSEGWVTVSSTPKTFDLLDLKARESIAVVSDTKLQSGTYQQVRMQVSKVMVTDAEGEHEAKLPSGDLKITAQVIVKPDATATATFDFIADESLHVTGNGKYVMAPVIKVETRTDAQVQVKEDQTMEITGGSVKTNVKLGMDIKGNVGIGLKIPADAVISIDTIGIIGIG